MTCVLYRTVDPQDAAAFCNPLAAGIAIRRMLAAVGDRGSPEYPSALYITEGNSVTTGNMNFDLSQQAVVIFAKSKAALKIGLENVNSSITIPGGMLAVVKNNYSGLGSQLPTWAALPLAVLLKQIQTNGRSWWRNHFGGQKGEVMPNTTYASYARVGRSVIRVNAMRSGYYILLCQAADIANDYDLSSKRAYTIPTRSFDLATVSRLISTDM